MIQLIVQGEELDLFKNEIFAISKSISKVGRFDLRFGDVSIAFTVPSTSKNNRIFRYLTNLNNDNLGAFRRFEGEIREDDAILSTGFYQILSTNLSKKEIKIRFLGGNSDWFDLIKDRFINENYPKEEDREKQLGNPNLGTYSLNYLNHQFEDIEIINSKDNTEGYIYYLCDNGANSDRNNNIVTESDFQIGVYEHTIFDNIFNSLGIKTQGTLFNDPLFRQTIITSCQDLTQFDKQNNTKRFNVSNNQTVPSIVTGTDSDFGKIDFTVNDSDQQWNGNTFTLQYDNDDILFFGRIITDSNQFFFNTISARIDIRIIVNGVEVDRITKAPVTSESDSNILSFGTWSIEFDGVNNPVLNVGDVVEIEYLSNTSANNFIPTVLKTGTSSYLQSYISYDINGAIIPYDINNVVPKIKQSDFIKEIMFRSCVVSQYDPKKRVLTLDKFQKVEDNKSNSVDWSHKIDLSKDIEIDFNKVVQNYFKKSSITYSEDDKDVQLRLFKTVSKNGLGDGIINIDNDNLTDEGNIFTSIYAPTKDSLTFPLSGTDFNFYIPYIPVFNSSNEVQDLKPRLLIANPNTPVNNFSPTFNNVSLNGSDETNVGYAFFAKQITADFGIVNNDLDTNLFTLSYENYTESNQNYIGLTLLERNYDLYRKILNNPVFVPIYMNLDNIDVQNVDFLKPIWLDFSLDTGYYYLEEISQYKGDGSTTKCNLIKI